MQYLYDINNIISQCFLISKGINSAYIYFYRFLKLSSTEIAIYYVNIHSVNPLYFIIIKAVGYIEEINGNKYLTLVSNNKNKEKLKKKTYRTLEQN